MKECKEITHYAGFDWARNHHVVVIVNQQGQIVADFEFEHSVEGWKSFGEKTAGFVNLAVAIETMLYKTENNFGTRFTRH